MLKTLGGERLGSGNKMKVAMHNYERSTHNLGNAWRSTAGPGYCIPFYKKLCQNGDTWSIDLSTIVRTMPAIGPCFGSFKLQLDMFEVPIRLYNGILHNNMTKIGMDMSKVKLPKVKLQTKWINPNLTNVDNFSNSQVSPSSLMHYLGIKGLGDVNHDTNSASVDLTRKFNAVPLLAYYDIMKNYYANKQEKYAYVIDVNTRKASSTAVTNITTFNFKGDKAVNLKFQEYMQTQWHGETTNRNWYVSIDVSQSQDATVARWMDIWNGKRYVIEFNGPTEYEAYILYSYMNNNTRVYEVGPLQTSTTIKVNKIGDGIIDFSFNGGTWANNNAVFHGLAFEPVQSTQSELKLTRFELENIDKMRINLLKATALNTEYVINDADMYPYKANYELDIDESSKCKHPLVGLMTKTYQSDIFNNWLSSEWISGVNGIAEVTAVDTSSGSFTMDALNLAHKVYNMLNRIAVSGGTYEDWQEAVFGEDAIRKAESPIYCGGLSGIIAFEEVVSTADTQTTNAGDQPLGSLAGKGTLVNVKGGHVEVHIKEPSYIIGIMSITPLIDYSQGNDFDMVELDSLNDIHKPALDGIGFQNLILEYAAWWGTYWDEEEQEWRRLSGGKLPAWIEYMTSVNEVHGDFADKNKLGFMVLNRDYERGNSLLGESVSYIEDWTTYINPTKYNYMFADVSLSAQNFWVQIGIDAIARRKMSARVIPNL